MLSYNNKSKLQNYLFFCELTLIYLFKKQPSQLSNMTREHKIKWQVVVCIIYIICILFSYWLLQKHCFRISFSVDLSV